MDNTASVNLPQIGDAKGAGNAERFTSVTSIRSCRHLLTSHLRQVRLWFANVYIHSSRGRTGRRTHRFVERMWWLGDRLGQLGRHDRNRVDNEFNGSRFDGIHGLNRIERLDRSNELNGLQQL